MPQAQLSFHTDNQQETTAATKVMLPPPLASIPPSETGISDEIRPPKVDSDNKENKSSPSSGNWKELLDVVEESDTQAGSSNSLPASSETNKEESTSESENFQETQALKEELAEMRMKLAATNLILSRKDQELVKAMKREEVQIKKLRSHIQSNKEIQERRDNTLEILFQLGVQQNVPVAELHARFRDAYFAYEDASLKHLRKEVGEEALDDLHRQVVENSVDEIEHDRADDMEKSRLKEEFADPSRIQELKETFDLKQYLHAAEHSRNFQRYVDSNGLPADSFSPTSTPITPRKNGKMATEVNHEIPMLKSVLSHESRDSHHVENGRKFKIQLRRKVELNDCNIQTEPFDLSDPEVRQELYKQHQTSQKVQTVAFDHDIDIDFVKKQTNYSEDLKKIQEKYSKLASNSRYRDQLATDTGFMLHNAKIIDMLNTSIDIILNPQDEKKTTESLKMLDGLYKKVAIVLCQVSPQYNQKRETLKWMRLQQKHLRTNVNEMRTQMQAFEEFIKQVSAEYLKEVDQVTNAWIEKQKELQADKERQLQIKEEVLRMKEEAFVKRLDKLKSDEADNQARAKKQHQEQEAFQKMKKHQESEQRRLYQREKKLEQQLKEFKEEKSRIIKLEKECNLSKIHVKNERVMIEQLLKDQRVEEKRLREERSHHTVLLKELQGERKRHDESIASMKEERDRLAQLKREHSVTIITESISTQTPGSYTCSREVQTVGAKLFTADEIQDLLRIYSSCRQKLANEASEIKKLKKTLEGQKRHLSKKDESKSRYQKQVVGLLQQNISELKQKMLELSEEKSGAKRRLLRILPEMRFLMGASKHEVEEQLSKEEGTEGIVTRTRRSHTVTSGAPALFAKPRADVHVFNNSIQRPSSMQLTASTKTKFDEGDHDSPLDEVHDFSPNPSSIDEPSPFSGSHVYSKKYSKRKRNAMFENRMSEQHQNGELEAEENASSNSDEHPITRKKNNGFDGTLHALEMLLFGHLYHFSFPSDVFRKISTMLSQFKETIVEDSTSRELARLRQSSMIRQLGPSTAPENRRRCQENDVGSNQDSPSVGRTVDALVQTTPDLLIHFLQSEGAYTEHIDEQSPNSYNCVLPSIAASRSDDNGAAAPGIFNGGESILKRRARAGYLPEEQSSDSPKRHLIPIHYTNEIPHIANHLLPHVRYDSKFVRQVKETFPNYTDTDVANFYPHLHASEEEHSFSPPRRLSMLNQRMKERQFFGANGAKKQNQQTQQVVDKILPWSRGEHLPANEFAVYTSKDITLQAQTHISQT
mmetsp:Transcript_11391/g.42775  ORF Transcript_11391/g.42775 Transcript_11391/m.42775 type:complete len:1275 (-) Transcript_11391:63-3887(-)